MLDALSQFESLLPQVCAWAQQQEANILRQGGPLSASEIADARHIGVQYPEQVRLLQVAQIPMPEDPALREAARQAGLLSPYTGGMSLRYGIFIQTACWRQRDIIAHELAHTAQYERLGGFAPFMRQYLTECLTVGYAQSPLELEAIAAARQLPTA